MIRWGVNVITIMVYTGVSETLHARNNTYPRDMQQGAWASYVEPNNNGVCVEIIRVTRVHVFVISLKNADAF